MTTIAGTDLIRTPCCGELYTAPVYGSINYSAQEVWTDGQRVQTLAPPIGGVRRCACGHYFLLKRADRLKFFPRLFNEQPLLPPLGRRLREARDSDETQSEPSVPLSPPPPASAASNVPRAEPGESPPSGLELPAVIDPADLPRAIAAANAADDVELETIARCAWWRHLNDPYRARYRALRGEVTASPEAGFPEFEATAEQAQNMRTLLDLLMRQPGPDWMEVAELHRELGDIRTASQALLVICGVTPRSPALAQVIHLCLKVSNCGPVRYRI